MATTFRPPRSLFRISVDSASPSTSSAMITSERPSRATFSRMGSSDWMEEILLSYRRIDGSSISVFIVFVSVMKYGEMKPRSNFMPSTTSSSSFSVLPSCTLITPSLPTFSIAVAINWPIVLSLFAEIDATCMISSLLLTFFDMLRISATTASTARFTPRRRSIGFRPAATDLQPSA